MSGNNCFCLPLRPPSCSYLRYWHFPVGIAISFWNSVLEVLCSSSEYAVFCQVAELWLHRCGREVNLSVGLHVDQSRGSRVRRSRQRTLWDKLDNGQFWSGVALIVTSSVVKSM